MWNQVGQGVARGPVAALFGALVVAAGVLPGACSIDQRKLGGVPGDCEGPACVAIQMQRPEPLVCLQAGCPADDACRSYADAPAAAGPDAGCTTIDDCPFTWKPAAPEGGTCAGG